MTRKLSILAALGLALAVAGVVRATADEVQGRYRVYLFDGRQLDGDVKQLADGSYEVKTKHGIVLKLKKQDVKRLLPLEETVAPPKIESPGDTGVNAALARRAITDEEIEEIVAGIEAELVVEEGAVDVSDLDAPLPCKEESVQEMLRLAGGEGKAKVIQWPHFVLVYTASDEAARKLGSRLESVWRWNAKFVKRLGLTARRPDYKLEVFFFSTWQEFQSYSLNKGSALPEGVLGYYAHDINRSHFFDLWDMPMFQAIKKELEEGRNLPPERRRFLRNYINAWVEYENQATIQHEAGHHIHFNTGVFSPRTWGSGGSAPTWLVEGATMQFEVPPSEKGGAGLGELNDSMLHKFRQLYPRWSAPELKSFLLNNYEWYQGYNYPRGWAIVYYMWKQHRDGLGKYIRTIDERPPNADMTLTQLEKELEECFGRIDDQWIEKFYEFLDGLSVRQSRLPPEL